MSGLQPTALVTARRHPWMRNRAIKRLVYLCLLLPLFITIAGMFFSNIVPSSTGVSVGIGFGVIGSLLWMAFTVVGYRAGCYNGAPGNAFQRPSVLISMAMLFGFMFGYGACTWTLPWITTALLGTDAEQVVTVVGWDSGGRSCPRPDIGKGLFVLAPRALCLPSHARMKMPPGTRIRISGPSSVFGMNAERVSVVQ